MLVVLSGPGFPFLIPSLGYHRCDHFTMNPLRDPQEIG